jgi:hypothetical protein
MVEIMSSLTAIVMAGLRSNILVRAEVSIAHAPLIVESTPSLEHQRA